MADWMQTPATDPAWRSAAQSDEWSLVEYAGGGRIMRNREGKEVFVSEGVSTSDPDAIERIREGSTGPQEAARTTAEQVVAQRPVSARAAKFIQGYPLLGQYTDEAIGMMYGDEAMENVREARKAMDVAYPGQSLALELGGGVLGAATVAPSLAVNMPGRGLGTKMAWGGAAGAGGGAIEGFVSGYGAGDEGDRLESAKTWGMLGGAFGLGLGALGPAVVSGFHKLFSGLAKSPLRTAAKELGVSQDVVKVLRAVIDTENIQDARKIIDDMGGDAFLADLTPQARNLLDAAIQLGGKGSGAAIKPIDARAVMFGDRISTMMDDIMGEPAGIVTASRIARNEAGDEVANLYNKAYNTPINYASPEGVKLEEILGRIPDSIFDAAAKQANDLMTWHGFGAKQVLAEIADDGTVIKREMPNVVQLDYLKRGLDSVVGNHTDITGKVDSVGMLAADMAREVRMALRDAVPVYGDALETAADIFGYEDAARIGYALLRTNTTRESARAALQGLSGPEHKAAMSGVRNYIDDTLANIKAVASDPNTEAREVTKLWQNLSSRSARNKMVSLLGGEQAGELIRELERAKIAITLRAATARNASTASRLAAERMVEAITGPTMIEQLQRGSPGQATQQLIQAMTGVTDEALALRKQGLYADIAEALVDIKGPEADRALRLLQYVDINEPLEAERAAAIARGVASLFVPAQQVGTRVTARGLQE